MSPDLLFECAAIAELDAIEAAIAGDDAGCEYLTRLGKQMRRDAERGEERFHCDLSAFAGVGSVVPIPGTERFASYKSETFGE